MAFVIDKTSSLGVPNFLLLKGFLLELVAALNIGPDATHTGIITFNRKPKVVSNFANSMLYSNEAVHDFLAKISVVLGDRTFTDKALMAAANKLFTEEGGDRPDFPNVLILLTDGRTNPTSKPFSTIIPHLEVRILHSYSFLLFLLAHFYVLGSADAMRALQKDLLRVFITSSQWTKIHQPLADEFIFSNFHLVRLP